MRTWEAPTCRFQSSDRCSFRNFQQFDQVLDDPKRATQVGDTAREVAGHAGADDDGLAVHGRVERFDDEPVLCVGAAVPRFDGSGAPVLLPSSRTTASLRKHCVSRSARFSFSAAKYSATGRGIGWSPPRFGYESESSFGKAFKRVMGTSPGEYRQRRRRDEEVDAGRAKAG